MSAETFRHPPDGNVWLPLQGPGGQTPKAPAVSGWQRPGYEGLTGDPRVSGPAHGWIGLRCDGLVVVDCDTRGAAKAWSDDPKRLTFTRKTPRGFHFIYRWVPGAPTSPAVGVLPNVDIRAGAGSQIVFYAPGYHTVVDERELRDFDPAWLPDPRVKAFVTDAIGWTEMPDGVGNNVMAAIAGALRKQGMAEKPIRTILSGINKLTMTRSPMSGEEIALIARSICRYDPDPDLDYEVDE